MILWKPKKAGTSKKEKNLGQIGCWPLSTFYHLKPQKLPQKKHLENSQDTNLKHYESLNIQVQDEEKFV